MLASSVDALDISAYAGLWPGSPLSVHSPRCCCMNMSLVPPPDSMSLHDERAIMLGLWDLLILHAPCVSNLNGEQLAFPRVPYFGLWLNLERIATVPASTL
jgi:hypothetical protein